MNIEDFLKSSDFESAISYLQKIISDKPDSYNERIQLALLYSSAQVNYYPGSIDILESILKFSKNDIKSILLLGYIEYIKKGSVSERCFKLLEDCILDKSLSNDNHFKDLLVLKCYYFEGDINKYRNEAAYLNIINQLLEMDRTITNCYLMLSKYFESKLNYSKALENNKLALNSITHIYEDEGYVSPIDFEEFIEEKFSKRHISSVNYSMLEERRDHFSRLAEISE